MPASAALTLTDKLKLSAPVILSEFAFAVQLIIAVVFVQVQPCPGRGTLPKVTKLEFAVMLKATIVSLSDTLFGLKVKLSA